jgi:hypothetical protein
VAKHSAVDVDGRAVLTVLDIVIVGYNPGHGAFFRVSVYYPIMAEHCHDLTVTGQLSFKSGNDIILTVDILQCRMRKEDDDKREMKRMEENSRILSEHFP